ncbi:MAG: hypothetical protein ACR2N2_11780 [Acidimicrobiia bacterium]
MILLSIIAIGTIAIVFSTAASFRPTGFAPSSIERRLLGALPSATRGVSESAFQRREYEWTVEYDNPVGSQRIVLNQDSANFGELAAVDTARTTAMMHRGTTIELWVADRTTGERTLADALRVESRRVA